MGIFQLWDGAVFEFDLVDALQDERQVLCGLGVSMLYGVDVAVFRLFRGVGGGGGNHI